MSVDSALKRAQIAVEEMARKGPHTDVPLYDHSYLQPIDKEKINRKLEENIIRNNIKELENKRDNERQEMHKAYYGKYELKNYDIDTMNEVLDIQEMLVDAGYDIGTYKYGERAGEIMLDGFWGPRTEKAYAKYLDDNFKKIVSEKNNIIKGDYDFSSLLNRGACDEKGCAAGMFNLYADIVGWDAVRNSGMIGDAWTLKKSMEDNGAYIKYNIFDGMKKPTIENHHESIMNAVNSNPLDYTSLQQGDVVGIYYARSNYNPVALQEGKGTWNSHVGLISGYDDDGMPLITHNLSGNLEHDRADEVEDLLGRDMHITWVADPISGTGFKYKQIDKDSKEWKDYSDENKEYIDFMERKIYDHALKEELTDDDYFTNEERLKLNSNINHVKNNVSKIVDELGIPIDENKLTEVVLGLGNVETRLGLRNPTQEDIDDTLWQKKRMNNYINSPVIPTIFGPTETDLNDDGDTDDPGEKVNPYNVDPEEVSLGLGKMKINHLDEFTKNYFDIDRNTIQSDDKSLNLMIAKTAKAKYFLDQYSKRNKALNLSEHDRWMMAALMHNQGDEILLNFGTNEKYSLDEQVSRLRDLYEGRVSDMSATDFGHLSKLTVGDSKWKQMNKDAYERHQLAKYVKKTPRIYDALPKNLKRKVNRVSQGGWLKDGMNIINVRTFNLDDLKNYFVNSDEFEYAKGHESYISKLNRYITRSEQEYPYEQVYDTKRGKLTRQEILELALIESGNFQALVNGLSPAMEDYIIGTYYSGTDSAMTRDVVRQKGGSVPTEAEAKKNPRYNKDMDDDGIPVGLDIDDSVRVPKNIMLLQAMKESSLDPKKVSKKGAQGLTQVMPATLKDYISATGDKDVDVFNWKDSMKIQDWYMNNLYNRPWINKQNQTEQVRLAKTLAAYNWGPTKFNEYLNKKKSQGVNIYDNDMSWINDLPKETKEYVNTILFRNNEKFEGWVTDFNKNQDKELFINAYSEEYKKGGSLIFPEWKRIKKHWKRYLSGKSINRDMYNKLVAYGFIKKKKYKKKKKRSRSLKNIPSNYILNSIKLGKMKKGGNLSHQVKIYEDYVKGIFDGTSLENKAKSVVDKINRFYYYDLKGKNTHTLDHIKKLQKGGGDILSDMQNTARLNEAGYDTTLGDLRQYQRPGDMTKEEAGESAETALSFFPYTGEAIDFKNTVKSAAEGRYGDMVLNAAGLAIPFLPGKVLVKGKNAIKGLFKKGSKEVAEKASKEIPKWSKGIPTYAATNEAHKKAINNLMDQGKYLDEMGFDAKTLRGENMVFHGQTGGRSIVEVALPDGRTQLFYKSTGGGGKAVDDMWQPFGGFDEKGWFIKDGKQGYNIGNYEDFYNSKSYRDISGSLDKHMVDQNWDMSGQVLYKKGPDGKLLYDEAGNPIKTYPYRK